MKSTAGREALDLRFMQLALGLGRRGLGRTWPNPAVGAVLVREDAGGAIILGRGWTEAGGRPHAEPQALDRAGSAARGSTLYVTLEPCSHHGRTPPCADAIVAAGVARVVSAIEDPNPQVAGAGHARLRAAGIAVTIGVGAEAARQAHAGHIRRMREKRPQVMLKLAVSRDGKVALAGRKPVPITGEAARARVHRLRAMNDAVLTGIGTALADDPLLTCRLPGMADRSPVRVVLDSALRLKADSRLVATARAAPLWVIAAEGASKERASALREAGAEVVQLAQSDGGLDLTVVLAHLAARGITRLMVEAGPILAAAFIKADLVDEAAVLHAPKEIGSTGLDALDGLPLTALTQSPRLQLIGTEAVGEDALELFTRREECP